MKQEAAEFAAACRPLLEDLWKRRKADLGHCPIEPASARMCGFTSAFLAIALEEVTRSPWKLDGGLEADGGGMIDLLGDVRSHIWAVCEEGLIVDVTADQFGHPTILVADRLDPRYLSTMSEDDLAWHLERVRTVAQDWLEIARDFGLLDRPGAALVA